MESRSEIKYFTVMKKEKKEKHSKVTMEGVIACVAVIMWIILFPFIMLYDRIFGGWKK